MSLENLDCELQDERVPFTSVHIRIGKRVTFVTSNKVDMCSL
jgi:hypothetical protein